MEKGKFGRKFWTIIAPRTLLGGLGIGIAIASWNDCPLCVGIGFLTTAVAFAGLVPNVSLCRKQCAQPPTAQG